MVDGDVRHFVTELKSQSGGETGVHGSITLTQALLEEDLVDELRVVGAPSIQMHNRRLFEKGRPSRLSVSRCVTSPAGYILLDLPVDR